MKTSPLLLLAAVALTFAACGPMKDGKCKSNADCTAGQTCDQFTGACVNPIFGTGGGTGPGGGGGGGSSTGGGGSSTGGGGGATTGGGGGATTGGGGGATTGGGGGSVTGGGGGSVTGGGGGAACDGCFFNGSCIIRANSNNDTLCGQGGVQCATCSNGAHCTNYVCTGGTGGGGGAVTGGGGGTTGGGGGPTGGGGGSVVAGETCEQATAASTSFSGSTVGATSDYLLARTETGSGCNGYSQHPGADVVYRLTVPARSELTVTVQPTLGDGSQANPAYDPAIFLVATPATNCHLPGTAPDGGAALEARCIAASPDPFGAATDLTAPELLTWSNFSTSAADVFLVVESGWTGVNGLDTNNDMVNDAWARGDGTFTATVTTTALPNAPSNDTCAGARTLISNVTLPSETTQGATPDLTFATTNTCVGTAGLGDVFYAATVPNGQALTVEATANTTTHNIGINLFTGACASVATCRGATQRTAGMAATARWDNRSGASQQVLVQVATANQGTGTDGAPFSIVGRLAAVPPVPANDACTAPATLPAATTLNGTLVGASGSAMFASSPTGCTTSAEALDVYYLLQVPGGKTATITVTPSATLDTMVNVVTPGVCSGVTACLATDDTGFEGEADTATYSNTGTTTQSVLVHVASWYGAEGTFTISAVMSP